MLVRYQDREEKREYGNALPDRGRGRIANKCEDRRYADFFRLYVHTLIHELLALLYKLLEWLALLNVTIHVDLSIL